MVSFFATFVIDVMTMEPLCYSLQQVEVDLLRIFESLSYYELYKDWRSKSYLSRLEGRTSSGNHRILHILFIYFISAKENHCV